MTNLRRNKTKTYSHQKEKSQERKNKMIKRIKHPINRQFVLSCLIGLIFFGALIFFVYSFVSSVKNAENKRQIESTIDLTDSTTIQDSLPFVLKVDTVIIFKKIIIHDTIIKEHIVYKNVFKVDTIYGFVIIPIYEPYDTYVKECYYEYRREFNLHRFPEHGPLWEITDSTLRCK